MRRKGGRGRNPFRSGRVFENTRNDYRFTGRDLIFCPTLSSLTVGMFAKMYGFKASATGKLTSTRMEAPFLQRVSVAALMTEGVSAPLAEMIYDRFHGPGSGAFSLCCLPEMALSQQAIMKNATYLPPHTRFQLFEDQLAAAADEEERALGREVSDVDEECCYEAIELVEEDVESEWEEVEEEVGYEEVEEEIEVFEYDVEEEVEKEVEEEENSDEKKPEEAQKEQSSLPKPDFDKIFGDDPMFKGKAAHGLIPRNSQAGSAAFGIRNIKPHTTMKVTEPIVKEMKIKDVTDCTTCDSSPGQEDCSTCPSEIPEW